MKPSALGELARNYTPRNAPLPGIAARGTHIMRQEDTTGQVVKDFANLPPMSHATTHRSRHATFMVVDDPLKPQEKIHMAARDEDDGIRAFRTQSAATAFLKRVCDPRKVPEHRAQQIPCQRFRACERIALVGVGYSMRTVST